MSNIEKIKDVSADFNGNALHVKDNRTGEHFIVSTADTFDSGHETMVFRADDAGHITSWAEVAVSHAATSKQDMIDYLQNRSS